MAKTYNLRSDKPNGPVRREDSEGDNYILWRGDSLNSQDDDFSRWNCSSVNEVLQKYHTVKIKETYFPMMYEDDCAKNVHYEEDCVANSLGTIITNLVGSDGRIKDYSTQQLLEKLRSIDLEFCSEPGGMLGESDQEDDNDEDLSSRSKRRKVDKRICFSDDDLIMLVPFIMDLKKAHDRMVSSKPFYGNDTIKLFMRELIRYALFDQQHQIDVLISTLNNSRSQVIGLVTNAIHENMRTRCLLKGVPDLAVVSKTNKFLLYGEGKSIEDVDSGIHGEGQLILAMITSFVKASGDHAIYGLLLSPPLAEVYTIRKHEDCIQIQKLLSISHSGKCIGALVSLLHPIRKAAA